MSNNLTPSQLAQVDYNAGFRGTPLTDIVAIQEAESGGNPTAVGNGAVGISQIQWGAEGSLFQQEYPEASLTDPQTNADAAFTLYQDSGGFNDWTTFTGKEYQQYLPEASKAAQGIKGNQSISYTTGSALGGLIGGSEQLGVGVLLFIGALVLLAIGFYAMFHKEIHQAAKTAEQVGKVAVEVAPK